MCEYVWCKSHWRDVPACLPPETLCDGHIDCDDGLDEHQNCGKNLNVPTGYHQLIGIFIRCFTKSQQTDC